MTTPWGSDSAKNPTGYQLLEKRGKEAMQLLFDSAINGIPGFADVLKVEAD